LITFVVEILAGGYSLFYGQREKSNLICYTSKEDIGGFNRNELLFCDTVYLVAVGCVMVVFEISLYFGEVVRGLFAELLDIFGARPFSGRGLDATEGYDHESQGADTQKDVYDNRVDGASRF
jgi:hypothetical protein